MPWLQRHCCFVDTLQLPVLHGFGFGVFSQQALMLVIRNINDSFVIMDPNRLFGIRSAIKDLASERQKSACKDDFTLADSYFNCVLLKEALVFILQNFSGCTYQEAERECTRTDHRVMIKSLELSMTCREDIKRLFNNTVQT